MSLFVDYLSQAAVIGSATIIKNIYDHMFDVGPKRNDTDLQKK